MKTIFTYLLSLFWLTSFAQLKITGDGHIINETRVVGKNFHTIKSSGTFNITIEDGTQDGNISIEGESNILEKIETYVQDHVLYIQFENGYSYSYLRPIKIKLHSNHLSHLELSGSGEIITKGFQKSDEFSVQLKGSGGIKALVDSNKTKAYSTGSGDIELSGKTQFFEINTRGSGDLMAYELSANEVNINKSGSGDVQIHTNGNLDIHSTGSGSVMYQGKPTKINSDILGSGKVVNAN